MAHLHPPYTPPATHTHHHVPFIHIHSATIFCPISLHQATCKGYHSQVHMHTHITLHKTEYVSPSNVSTHPCCTPCSAALNRTWIYCQSLLQAEPGTSSVPAVTKPDALAQCHSKPTPCLTSLLLSTYFLPFFLPHVSFSSPVCLSIFHWVHFPLNSFHHVHRVKGNIQNASLCEQVLSAAER